MLSKINLFWTSQKFCNILDNANSSVPNTLADIMKVTNHIGLWDVKIAWYSLNTSCWISLFSYKHGIGIDDFRPTWHRLIVEEISSPIWLLYYDQLCISMTRYDPFRIEGTTLQVHLCSIQIIYRVKQYNMSAHQIPRDYQPQQVFSTAWTASITRYTKLVHTKILQNFSLNLIRIQNKKNR